ncbi:MAG: hypothetical protein EOM76_07185 [Sphingobacteriia bacterium]|nr:hypothetical protein [Sphingobacteriia bacterium]
MTETNPFKGLSPEGAKRMYRELAKKCHPDTGGSNELMHELMQQYSEYMLQYQNSERTGPGYKDIASYFDKYMNSIPPEVLQFIESDPQAAKIHNSLIIALQYLDNRAKKQASATNTIDTIIKIVSMNTPPKSLLGQILETIKKS